MHYLDKTIKPFRPCCYPDGNEAATGGLPQPVVNVPVDPPTLLPSPTRDRRAGIVGHCTACGNPIYGRAVLSAEEYAAGAAEVVRTCSC